MKADRVAGLEAIRGWASLVVIFYHCLLAFFPSVYGRDVWTTASLSGTPALALVNGSAAVVIFFVLSGYVLALAVQFAGTREQTIDLAIRRLPRLAGPVVVVNLLAATLLVTGFYYNVEAGSLSQSIWLPSQYPEGPTNAWALLAAFIEGSVTAFAPGTSVYNSNLWTMRYEFAGSFIAFALAASCIAWPRLKFQILAAAAILATAISTFYLCFVVGAALSLIKIRRLPRPILAIVCVTVAAYFAGYQALLPEQSIVHADWYAWLRPETPEAQQTAGILLHTFSAIVLILLVTHTRAAATIGGRFGSLLGRLSFPLYLVHIPIICTVGSATYIALHPSPLAGPAAVLITIALSFMCAVPLAAFDERWRKILKVHLRPMAARSSVTVPLSRPS